MQKTRDMNQNHIKTATKTAFMKGTNMVQTWYKHGTKNDDFFSVSANIKAK